MNRRVMHEYMMKHKMNDQHYIYDEFRAQMGWKDDKTFDFIILIDGHEEEDDSIWKGLTQTMKRVVVKAHDDLLMRLNKRFAETRAVIQTI